MASGAASVAISVLVAAHPAATDTTLDSLSSPRYTSAHNTYTSN